MVHRGGEDSGCGPVELRGIHHSRKVGREGTEGREGMPCCADAVQVSCLYPLSVVNEVVLNEMAEGAAPLVPALLKKREQV